MKNASKYLGTIVLSAGLLFGATACGGAEEPSKESTAAAAEEKAQLTPAKAAETIEKFFEATTSDEIAAAFPDDADEKTFSEAVQLTDPEAKVSDVAAAMADFALVKVLDPKAELSIAVDESKIVVKDRKASVPVEAISVKSGDKAVANSAELADEVNDLVFRDGSWLIAFPQAPEADASETASPSASAEASADSKK
ncbi:hypothetical protein [Arthrobacter caoxuetaonis]|uniref:DUF4878 domain-containing protein n=1 Tax=Arthrobacter caoxuetaonis TaxID=2886935 RepID=A0A9X1MIN2_9MICC|nr:hypothetical protein [Arthrobacter caoxuetaonis]MCC3299254.1 hypothetical protein [Arthrobacter caoxuetaonis]USQ59252.1 hypothetical protein NF551_16850 [Arthrobacter caoxuetaonis]